MGDIETMRRYGGYVEVESSEEDAAEFYGVCDSLEAELTRLREENERLRAAYESDEEALRQVRDYARLRRIEAAAKELAAINLHESWRLDGHAAESYVAAVFPRWVALRAALTDQPTEEKA